MNINFTTYKNKAIYWFRMHQREIKVGAYCLAVGAVYGLVKGMSAGINIESDHVNRLIAKIPKQLDGDDFEEMVFDMSPEELLCFVDPDNLERLAEACKDRLKANE